MKYFLGLVLILFLSFPFIVAKASENEEWQRLVNKYGWEISYPACWITEGVEEVEAKDSPSVGIRPGPNCPKEYSKNWSVGIMTPLGIKISPPKSRIASSIESGRRRHIKYFNSNVQLKPNKTRSIYHVYKPDPPVKTEYIAWQLESICDGRNLSIGLSTGMSANRKIEAQKLSPLFKKMVESFVCRNP